MATYFFRRFPAPRKTGSQKSRAIVLRQTCEEFSNIAGLGQIRFPKNNISAQFEEIRKVLEREKIV